MGGKTPVPFSSAREVAGGPRIYRKTSRSSPPDPPLAFRDGAKKAGPGRGEAPGGSWPHPGLALRSPSAHVHGAAAVAGHPSGGPRCPEMRSSEVPSRCPHGACPGQVSGHPERLGFLLSPGSWSECPGRRSGYRSRLCAYQQGDHSRGRRHSVCRASGSSGLLKHTDSPARMCRVRPLGVGGESGL